MDSDEENNPESLSPLQKTSRKDLNDNVQFPNRTRGSERTLSVKQQAISKCFHCVLYVLTDITFR